MEVDLTQVRATKDRSPSFPFISLGKALDRAREFAAVHKRAAPRLAMAAPTWGYGLKSSGLLQTVAALKAYGLLEDSGAGEDRKIYLTDLAWKILLDTRPGAKEQALREAALRPRLIAEYIVNWGVSRPEDAHCISELQFDRGFTEAAARTFIRVFDDTISLANLSEDDSISRSSIIGPPSEVPSSHEPGESALVPEGALSPPRSGLSTFLANAARRVTAQTTANATPDVPRATLPLPEGLAALELPEGLSQESLEDVRDWIQVMLRRAERAIQRAQVDKPSAPAARPLWADLTFSPGEEVPGNGLYAVVHYGHMGAGQIELTKGSIFPACASCEGGNVRYHLA